LVEYCVEAVFAGPISSTSRLTILLLLLLLFLSSWPLPLGTNTSTGSNYGKENERGNLEDRLHLVVDSIAIGLL